LPRPVPAVQIVRGTKGKEEEVWKKPKGVRAPQAKCPVYLLRSANRVYDDDILKKLGCWRERDDKFHYDVKREEVKL
jgi:hypothetical protein